MQEPAPGTVPSGAPAPETGAAPPPSSPERLDRGVPDSAPAAEGAAPAPAGSPPTGAYPAPDPRRWQEQAAQYLAEAQALQARVQALYGEDEQARGIVARLQHLPGEYYLPEVDRYNRESGTRQAEAQAALGRLEQLKLAYERLAFDAEKAQAEPYFGLRVVDRLVDETLQANPGLAADPAEQAALRAYLIGFPADSIKLAREKWAAEYRRRANGARAANGVDHLGGEAAGAPADRNSLDGYSLLQRAMRGERQHAPSRRRG